MLVFGFEKVVTGEAFVRLVHAVYCAHVRLKMGQLREPGVRADGALEWLFTSVLTDVQLKNAGVRKGLPANLCRFKCVILNNFV